MAFTQEQINEMVAESRAGMQNQIDYLRRIAEALEASLAMQTNILAEQVKITEAQDKIVDALEASNVKQIEIAASLAIVAEKFEP